MRRRGTIAAITVLAATAAVAVVPTAAVANVVPDRKFGDRGFVTTRIAGHDAAGYATTVSPNGKIVVAGQATTKSGNGQVLVARYRADGTLDRRFASRGLLRTKLPKKKGPFIATAVARERSTGRLVIAGGYGQGSMLAMRLEADGSVDRKFGRAGIATVAVGGIANSVAIQRDGRILLGGSNANENGRPMVVSRLKRNGKLDRGFAGRGTAQLLFWDANLAASAGVTGLSILSTGEIVGSGHLDYIGSDGHGSAGVFRLSSTGARVQGFGTDGHVEVAFTMPSGAFGQWFPCAMAVDSQGAIAITGDGSVSSDGDLLTARLTPSGSPDPSFGPSGDGRAVVTGLGEDSITTCGAALTQDGRLIAGVGPSLAAVSSSGAADPSFGPGGLFQISRPKNVDINAIARTGSNRFVVAGGAGDDFYVARYRLR